MPFASVSMGEEKPFDFLQTLIGVSYDYWFNLSCSTREEYVDEVCCENG